MLKSMKFNVSHLAAAFLLVVLLGVMYWPTLAWIADICWNDNDYSHGLLLPFITFYIIWNLRKERWPAIEERLQLDPQRNDLNKVSTFAVILLISGLSLFFVGQLSQSAFASWLSLFPVLTGLLYLLFGSTVAPYFVGPLLLNFMAKPLPDSLTISIFWPLQVLAAKISAAVLKLFDVPVYLVGNIIEIPHMRLLVEEACSGMRSVMSLVTVACIIPFLFPLSKLAKQAVFVASIFLAVGLNVVRVAATGLLAHFYDPSAAEGFFHEFSGLIVFIFGLAILYSIVSLMTRKPSAETD